MGQEQEPVPLRHINIDVIEGIITLEGIDGRAIRFNPLQAIQQLLATAHSPLPAQLQEPDTTAESKENPGTITVAGRLKTQPREGSPDKKGRPTATARLAYHQDGQKDAQFYYCTFHGGTREIALKLPIEAPITILGYPHPAKEDDKMDTFSVMRLIKYPGQQPKGNAT